MRSLCIAIIIILAAKLALASDAAYTTTADDKPLKVETLCVDGFLFVVTSSTGKLWPAQQVYQASGRANQNSVPAKCDPLKD